MTVVRREISKTETNGVLPKVSYAEEEKKERESLVLWISPITTLYYFFLECLFRCTQLRFTIARNWRLCSNLLLTSTLLFVLYFIPGPHSEVLQKLKKVTFWWSWWFWLGFLSSCGFGTGLHTFVLYLGPFIAEVTMSAYECGSLDFPSPPYPDRIICPEDTNSVGKINFWKIMGKVQMESIMWGFGTAVGELPPYFMARGARLSDRHEEELEELENILEVEKATTSSDPLAKQTLTFQKRVELHLHRLILRAGFMGILLCASIPNPLFDLAGMTCGHFLVPFWSFFGATFIGKALIKVHLQQFTVIALSSEHHVESLVGLIGRIPVYGQRLQAPFLDYLKQQKASLRSRVSPTRITRAHHKFNIQTKSRHPRSEKLYDGETVTRTSMGVSVVEPKLATNGHHARGTRVYLFVRLVHCERIRKKLSPTSVSVEENGQILVADFQFELVVLCQMGQISSPHFVKLPVHSWTSVHRVTRSPFYSVPLSVSSALHGRFLYDFVCPSVRSFHCHSPRCTLL
ncbi:Vacuole membrane protein 1 [Fasciola hepatica]|uniref:Vacuole membrane protein 1 n=1 Tax=Fasciola hepatica TaxID=6192 RepID=A0A4E0R336_FASHE|nr:Vacuole membrane protein 1 [Fasciola hepatica]